MLAAIRAFAKSWVAALLIGPLMLSFLLFGVHDVFHPKFSNAVVTAGSHETSPAEFKRDFGIKVQQWSQQNNQDLSIADAIAGGFDQQVLTAVEAREALSEYLQRIGIRPSTHLVDVEINEAPAFANALGQFDQTKFDQWLQETNLTAQQVKDSSRDDLATQHLLTGMAAGLQAPMIYGAAIASYLLESRNVSYFVLNPQSVPAPPPPADAQLQAIINQHVTDLTRPEMRTLSVVRFSAKAVAPKAPLDQAKVQALYETSKSRLAQPEKRTLVEFATRDASKAATIVSKLKAGQTPDAIAKALGIQPITYDDKPKINVVDPAVADAAFSAKSGEIVGPISSPLAGFAVVQVTKVTPGMTPTLEQLRPQLEAAVRTIAAEAIVYEAVKKYQASHDSGANLADSARAAGANPIVLGPITAQGRNLQNQPDPGVTPKLLKEAFALAQGGESELEDEGEGEYFAIRVERVTPPTLPTLAELRPLLTQAYTQQAFVQRLSAEADALIKAIKKGQSFEAAAASAKSTVKTLPNLTRQALQQNRQLSPGLVNQIFDTKQGDLFDGVVGPGQIIVARVDTVRPAATADAAQLAVAGSKSLSQGLLEDMIAEASARTVSEVRPEGDLTAARQALGVAPKDQPKSGAPPKHGPAL